MLFKFWLLQVLTIAIVCAKNVELGNFRLTPDKLMIKQRYVYSDFAPDGSKTKLKNATARFDIGAFALNHDDLADDEFLRLYLLVGNTHVIESIDRLLKENKQTLDEKHLSYDYFLKPFHCPCEDHALEFYHSIDISRDANYADDGVVNITMFNHSIPIEREGVYKFAFLYEVVDKEKKVNDEALAN